MNCKLAFGCHAWQCNSTAREQLTLSGLTVVSLSFLFQVTPTGASSSLLLCWSTWSTLSMLDSTTTRTVWCMCQVEPCTGAFLCGLGVKLRSISSPSMPRNRQNEEQYWFLGRAAESGTAYVSHVAVVLCCRRERGLDSDKQSCCRPCWNAERHIWVLLACDRCCHRSGHCCFHHFPPPSLGSAALLAKPSAYANSARPEGCFRNCPSQKSPALSLVFFCYSVPLSEWSENISWKQEQLRSGITEAISQCDIWVLLPNKCCVQLKSYQWTESIHRKMCQLFLFWDHRFTFIVEVKSKSDHVCACVCDMACVCACVCDVACVCACVRDVACVCAWELHACFAPVGRFFCTLCADVMPPVIRCFFW